MLTLYIASSVVAGVLLLLSLFGGGDHEFGHDTDTDTDLNHEVDHESDHGGFTGGAASWIPFLSLRFYTYFFAGLGVAGLALTFLTTTPPSLILILSLIVGSISGLATWITIKILRRTESSSAATESDCLGKEAEVTVGIKGRNAGRIRCTVRGDIIDFLAVSEEEAPLNPGDRVVIVAMDGGKAEVIRLESIFNDQLPTRTSQST